MAAEIALRYDYVAVGHVTVDVLPGADGRQRRQPGGGAFYSALQAARLGLRTLVITRGEPQELRRLLAPFAGEMTVEILPAEQSTALETSGSGSQRRQLLRAWAGPISPADLRSDATPAQASILHLAPVAQETPPAWPVEAAFVGLTAQGLLRHWDERSGEIAIGPIETSRLPSRLDAVVISASERASCTPLFDRSVAVIAVTAGEGPTTVHLAGGGAEVSVAPRPIGGAHDDLGAGDVFAAAFFIALREGRTPLDAATRGNAAAAVRISGRGPDAIGDLAAIERRALHASA
jgi:sugar/nucleoside kinase (ribokinase family)